MNVEMLKFEIEQIERDTRLQAAEAKERVNARRRAHRRVVREAKKEVMAKLQRDLTRAVGVLNREEKNRKVEAEIRQREIHYGNSYVW